MGLELRRTDFAFEFWRSQTELYKASSKAKSGGWGGFRTHYLWLMSPTLYQLSYPAERSAPADLQSTPHLYKIIMFSWLRGWDSNPQSQGYEPCEMPFLYPASSFKKQAFRIPYMSPQKSKSCSR